MDGVRERDSPAINSERIIRSVRGFSAHHRLAWSTRKPCFPKAGDDSRLSKLVAWFPFRWIFGKQQYLPAQRKFIKQRQFRRLDPEDQRTRIERALRVANSHDYSVQRDQRACEVSPVKEATIAMGSETLRVASNLYIRQTIRIAANMIRSLKLLKVSIIPKNLHFSHFLWYFILVVLVILFEQK